MSDAKVASFDLYKGATPLKQTSVRRVTVSLLVPLPDDRRWRITAIIKYSLTCFQPPPEVTTVTAVISSANIAAAGNTSILSIPVW